MSTAISFVDFLFELGADELLVSRQEATMGVVVVALSDGRRLLAVERSYRPGVKVLFEPTDEEVEIAKEGDPWKLWNSDRVRYMDMLDSSLEGGILSEE